MATDTGRVEVSARQDRQILEMHFRGTVSAGQFREAVAPTEGLLKGLRPGFTVVTDLTGLVCMDIECVRDLTGLMDRFLAGGAGRVVRVIPDPDKDIGFALLSLTHYRGRIPIETFTTRAEADRAL